MFLVIILIHLTLWRSHFDPLAKNDFISEIVTRKPAKIMSLDNLERKKNATHLRPEPATIPISNSTSLDDRLRSISKWMDNNEYSF